MDDRYAAGDRRKVSNCTSRPLLRASVNEFEGLRSRFSRTSRRQRSGATTAIFTPVSFATESMSSMARRLCALPKGRTGVGRGERRVGLHVHGDNASLLFTRRAISFSSSIVVKMSGSYWSPYDTPRGALVERLLEKTAVELHFVGEKRFALHSAHRHAGGAASGKHRHVMGVRPALFTRSKNWPRCPTRPRICGP